MSFSDNYKILSGQTDSADADIEVLEGGRGKRVNAEPDEFRLVISESNPNPNPNRDTDDIVEQKSDENDDSEGVIMTEDASASSASSTDLQMLQANLIASQSKQGANATPNASTNLESGVNEKDSLGKEWTKLVDQDSGKEYYYNDLTKDTMWFTPQPSKDYELRPPFGWYAVDNGGHIYLHNPQKNLIERPEDVTFADANKRPEEEAVEKKEETKSENLPSILMIEKTGETNDDESGSNGSRDKKIII
jgi:hypothetical protein